MPDTKHTLLARFRGSMDAAARARARPTGRGSKIGTARAAALKAARDEGRAAGVTAERDRITAILTSPEASGR